MIPVTLDISELSDLYNFSDDDVHAFKKIALKRIVSLFMRNLIGLAGRELKQTRGDYVRSIRMDEDGSSAVVIELFGFMPNAVEQGLTPFDMKGGFSRGKNVKRKIGGGWYTTVPFRHGVPSTLGDAQSFSGSMPTDVYDKAKSLSKGKGLKASSIGAGVGITVRPPVVVNNREYDAYKSKFSKYSGIQKTGKPGHSRYVSFRRVSDKSDDMSWIHSGIEARNLFNKALKNSDILYEIDLSRDEFFSKIGI